MHTRAKTWVGKPLANRRATIEYDHIVNFKQLLAGLMFWRRGEADAKTMPHTIVLLMRDARPFTQEELKAAGERGWGKRFDGKEDPMYFVSLNNELTILKAGKYVV